MKTVDIGRIGEDAAALLLKKQKLKVIERNIHISHNEIDIIFVEVKARTVDEDLYSPFGTPASAVTKEKQQRTLAAARGYMHSNKKYFDYQPRFDVIEIYLSKEDYKILKSNHIENAFGV